MIASAYRRHKIGRFRVREKKPESYRFCEQCQKLLIYGFPRSAYIQLQYSSTPATLSGGTDGGMELNRKRGSQISNIVKYRALLLMLAAPAVYLVLNNYIPMVGVIIAFKNVNYAKGIFHSDWVGFTNFAYLFATHDAYVITRNTLLYNLVFIVLNVVVPVSLAVALSEIRGKRLKQAYQTITLFPYFISMVVVSYLVLSLLSPDNGLLDRTMLPALGFPSVDWYNAPVFWPFILPVVFLWKTAGYSSIIYLASIAGIDPQYNDAIAIDGGSRWHQIRYVTLPHLRPTAVVLSVLAVGRIFNSDFGLFYQVPLNSGTLFPVTNVIDTYVYRALIQANDLGMASAAGVYQACVGLVLIIATNAVVRRINPELALF
jgi:putative aldouronate transport system permease protein